MVIPWKKGDLYWEKSIFLLKVFFSGVKYHVGFSFAGCWLVTTRMIIFLASGDLELNQLDATGILGRGDNPNYHCSIVGETHVDDSSNRCNSPTGFFR